MMMMTAASASPSKLSTSQWVFTARLRPSSECPQFADLWSESAKRRGRNISGSAHLCRPLLLQRRPAHCRCCLSAASRYDRREVAGMADFKMYLLHQFCSNRVKFFYSTQETQMQKMMDQNFESRFVIFENFFEILKRRRAVPLRPIWTIMVAAKLDQSRVLMTKFRQNRSTLEGRSAGQRHTHRDRQTDSQTNSAENNGPSGLQSGQYHLGSTTYPLPPNLSSTSGI